MAFRAGGPRAFHSAGLGEAFKAKLRRPGEWRMLLGGFAEALPMADNRVMLDPVEVDQHGVPQTRLDFAYSENDLELLKVAERDAIEMVKLVGGDVLTSSVDPGPGGTAIHEMGGAAMGHDSATSVLNAHNQLHDASNVFVTDGAAMASSACQNPSLTYMALTARAAARAVDKLKLGRV